MTVVRFEFRGTFCHLPHLRRILSLKVLEVKRQNPQLPVEAIADYLGTRINALKIDAEMVQDYCMEHVEDNRYRMNDDWRYYSVAPSDPAKWDDVTVE